MTNTISRDPIVGAVGGTTRFKALGTFVGNELRYYLTSKPTGSTLVCLDDVDTTNPVARQTARLAIDAQGFATATWDVSGHFLVEVHDVTVTRTPQKYPGAPIVADTDNDFAGAPVNTLADGDAAIAGRGTQNPLSFYYDPTHASSDYLVAQTLKKTIGSNPDTAVVAVIVDDTIETRLDDAVTLTPAITALAKAAAASDSVVGVLTVLQQGLPEEPIGDPIGLLTSLWAAHLATSATRNIHQITDLARQIITTPLTTLGFAQTRLHALEFLYGQHQADAAVHYHADTSNVMPDGVPVAVDLLTTWTRAWWFWRVMVNGTNTSLNYAGVSIGPIAGHFGDGFPHKNDASRSGEGQAYTFQDFPLSVEGVCASVAELCLLFNAHVAKLSVATAAHASTDTDNVVNSAVATDSIKRVNAICDGFDRHVANQSKDPTTGAWIAAATPYHAVASNVRSPPRASTLEGAVDLASRMIFLLVAHFTNASAHHGEPDSPGSGTNSGYAKLMPLMTRLVGYWYAASAPGAPAPRRWNVAGPAFIAQGWK